MGLNAAMDPTIDDTLPCTAVAPPPGLVSQDLTTQAVCFGLRGCGRWSARLSVYAVGGRSTEDGTMQDSGDGEIIMSGGGAWPADTDPMIISWERGDFAGSEYFSGSEYSSGSESISGDEYEASYTSKDEPGMMSAAADRPRRRGSARPHRVSRAAGPNRERKDCKTGSTEANAAAAALAAAAAEKARNPAQELLVPELLALLHADRWGTAAAGPPIRPLRLTVGQPLVDAVYREPRKHKRRQKASVGAIDRWKNSGGKYAKVTLDIPKALQRDVRTHKRS